MFFLLGKRGYMQTVPEYVILNKVKDRIQFKYLNNSRFRISAVRLIPE